MLFFFSRSDYGLSRVTQSEIRKSLLGKSVEERLQEFKTWNLNEKTKKILNTFLPTYMQTEYKMAQGDKIADIIEKSKLPLEAVLKDINTTLSCMKLEDRTAYFLKNLEFVDNPNYSKLDIGFHDLIDKITKENRNQLQFLMQARGEGKTPLLEHGIDENVIAIANSLKKPGKEIVLTPPLLQRFIRIISTLDPQGQKAFLEQCKITKDSPLYKKLPTSIQENL